jgi:ATP-dependent Clp protease ATP-binding subunit ClpA
MEKIDEISSTLQELSQQLIKMKTLPDLLISLTQKIIENQSANNAALEDKLENINNRANQILYETINCLEKAETNERALAIVNNDIINGLNVLNEIMDIHVRNVNHIIETMLSPNKGAEIVNDGTEVICKVLTLNDKSIHDAENNIVIKLQELNQNFQCTENQTRVEKISEWRWKLTTTNLYSRCCAGLMYLIA